MAKKARSRGETKFAPMSFSRIKWLKITAPARRRATCKPRWTAILTCLSRPNCGGRKPKKSSACHAMSYPSQARVLALLYRAQPKPRVEFAAVVCAATSETCHHPFDLAHARKISVAIWTAINEARRITLCWKRQRMTALLASDSQVAASLLPVDPVRCNPSPACAKLGQDVSEFVTQRALDLLRMRNQLRVQ